MVVEVRKIGGSGMLVSTALCGGVGLLWSLARGC